jgi:hypothetical protein
MSQRALNAHVPLQPGTYTVEQGLSRAANSHQTELSHLILAADHITEIFHTGGISYALMVGSSMLQLIELVTPHPR